VTGLANVRHISRIRFLEYFCVFADRRSHAVAQLDKAITGMDAGGRFTSPECGKRKPSPVFWLRIKRLQRQLENSLRQGV